MITVNDLKNRDNFFLMAGPCAIEGEDMALRIAEKVVGITNKLNIPYIFKGSYRKANRSRLDSFTGIGSRREELSFFDIDNFPCLGSSYQQVRLPAEESRDLQDIHILGSHCSFSCFVNIGYSRNTERVAYPAEYFQCFLIANAGKRIQT